MFTEPCSIHTPLHMMMTSTARLLALPADLVGYLLDLLSPLEAYHLAVTCKHLHNAVFRQHDSHWSQLYVSRWYPEDLRSLFFHNGELVSSFLPLAASSCAAFTVVAQRWQHEQRLEREYVCSLRKRENLTSRRNLAAGVLLHNMDLAQLRSLLEAESVRIRFDTDMQAASLFVWTCWRLPRDGCLREIRWLHALRVTTVSCLALARCLDLRFQRYLEAWHYYSMAPEATSYVDGPDTSLSEHYEALAEFSLRVLGDRAFSERLRIISRDLRRLS
jgi:hypothetical protein